MRRVMLMVAVACATLMVVAPARAAQHMPALMVQVAQPGIVSIPLTSLPTVDPAYLKVVRRGIERPAQISQGALTFPAEANDSAFTTTAAYWILADGTPGLRAIPTTTAALVWERDDRYLSVAPSVRGDRWFAGEVHAGGTPFALMLTLPTPVAAGSPIALALTSRVASSDHRIIVSYQGSVVGSARWSEATPGPQVRQVYLTQPLPAGPITLTVSLISTTPADDAVLLDSLTLPTVQVALPTLTPALRSAVATQIDTGPTPGQAGANVLILTHATFRPALDPLVALYQQRGESTAVVDVQDAYDLFSFGERDPEAIRSYIRRAVQHWTPAPRVVLLIGAGSVKMRVAADEPDPTFVPPYLLDIDPKYGEAACDTCYTRLDAGAVRNQDVPTLPIGRFPVRTLTEAQQLVAKTVTAMTVPAGGAWRQRVIALTDNDYEADGTRDRAASFPATANSALDLLPHPYQAERFFYAPNQPSAAPYYASPESLRQRFLPMFDSGAALMVYVGHASMWQWASTTLDAPTPFLLGLYDADARTNANKLPILLSLACLSGNFANPTLQTIDERLLLQTGGGVAATLSPTGSGVNTSHALLLDTVLPRLVARETLGAAQLAGLRAVAASGHNRDMLFTYGVLGNPDAVLPSPSIRLFVPIVISK